MANLFGRGSWQKVSYEFFTSHYIKISEKMAAKLFLTEVSACMGRCNCQLQEL